MKLTGIYEHKKSLQWDGHLSENRDERMVLKNKRGRVAKKLHVGFRGSGARFLLIPIAGLNSW